ncbi:unnamed protein product, partial [marine sediment metagenome]
MNWTNSTDEDGDDIIYYLEISTDNNFVTVDYANTTITETDLSGRTEDNVSLADGDYYWRVLAYDIEGNSSWSDVFAFNLSNPFVPSTPQIYPSATDHNFSFNGICENSSDIDSATINYEFYLDSSNPPTTLT